MVWLEIVNAKRFERYIGSSLTSYDPVNSTQTSLVPDEELSLFKLNGQ